MTHLGQSLVIHGQLQSDEDIVIDGVVQGQVHIRGAMLTVGERGKIEADVHGTRVLVRGSVHGSITATERIELSAEASVHGSLSANQVVIVDGARYDGSIDMQRRTVAAKVAQHRAGHTATG